MCTVFSLLTFLLWPIRSYLCSTFQTVTVLVCYVKNNVLIGTLTYDVIKCFKTSVTNKSKLVKVYALLSTIAHIETGVLTYKTTVL